jgi:uncharacterized protein (TIRG00374 family)
MRRKSLFNLLKIIISLTVIVLILSRIDLDKLKDVLIGADLIWLIVAIGLVFLGVGVRAKRWQILLTVFKVPVSLKELTTIYFIGFAFNNVLPSGVGGDAIRMVELNQHTSRASDAVTSVIVERFLGLYSALTLAFITLIFAWNVIPVEVALVSVLIFIGITVVGFVLINKPLYHILRRIGFIRKVTDIKFVNNLFASFQDYNLPVLWRSFVVGLLFNVILIAMNVAIGVGLGIHVSLVYYLIFIPLVALTLTIPITFAGFGARESAYIYLFTQVDVARETALALSLLIYLLGNLTPGLVGGGLYLWRGARAIQSDFQPVKDVHHDK